MTIQRQIGGLPMTLISTLFLLYVVQGIWGGLIALALPTILRDRGLGTQSIGLIYLCLLPWVCKFLWASLVDRYGERRQWMLSIQCAYALGFGALAWIDLLPTQAFLPALAVVMVLLSVLTATQDIAVDGYAIESATRTQRGLVNGIQVGGASVGAVFGGGGTLILLPQWGWSGVMLLFTASMVLVLLVLKYLNIPSRSRSALVSVRKPSLTYFLQRPEAKSYMVFALLWMLSQRFAFVMMAPYLLDSGVTITQIGWVQGAGGALASLAAAVLSPLLLHRWGWRPVAVTMLSLQGSLWCVLLLCVSAVFVLPPHILVVLILLQSGLIAASFVAFYALAMGWCDLAQAGTDFSVFQSLDSAVAISCAVLAGYLAQSFGYGVLFGGAIVLVALTLFAVVGRAQHVFRLSLAKEAS